MSKNLSRKGLALGAIVALGSSLFAGSPAAALDPVLTVSPAAGTSLKFISGEEFALKVTSNTAYTWSASSNLKWEIKNADAATVTAEYNNAAGTPATQATTNATSTATTITATGAAGAAGTAAGANRLGLSVPATTATKLIVRAYIEDGTTAGLDAADLASAPVTVDFVKSSSVVPTIAITTPYEGDTAVVATVKFDVNNEQLSGSDFGVWFTNAAGTNVGGLSDNNSKGITLGTWNADDSVFDVTTAGSATIAKNTAVRAQVYYEDGGTFTYVAAEKIGDAVSVSVTARSVARLTATVVRGDYATGTSTTEATSNVLRNSTFQFKFVGQDADGVAVPNLAVGATVVVGSALGTLADSRKVTVNGTEYTDNAKLPGYTSATVTVSRLSLTTDATGAAVVTVKTTGFTASEVVRVTFKAQNQTTWAGAASAAESAVFYLANVNGTKAVTTDGAAANVLVKGRNQFGGPLADSYLIQGIWDATNGSYSAQTTASTTASSVSADLSNGSATLAILDNGTGTGVHFYDIQARKKLAGNNLDSALVIENDFRVDILAASAVTPGAVKLGTSSGAATELGKNTAKSAYVITAGTSGASDTKNNLAINSSNKLVSYDARALGDAASVNETGVAVYGVVQTGSTATQATTAIANAAVTVTTDGSALFKVAQLTQKNDAGTSNDASFDVYGLNTLTFNADGSGEFTLNVYSQKAGLQTVTITSGGVSSKIELYFAAADDNEGANLVITAPTYILPGKTLKITGQITDKFGNPIVIAANTSSSDADLLVSYDGPGLVVGSLPEATDAAGKFTVNVLLGSLDDGTGTITAKYDRNGDEDYTDLTGTTPDLVKSATVTVGSAPVAGATAAIAGSTKRFFVSVSGNTGAKNVVVKVAGKTFRTLKGATAKKTYVVAAPKGSHKVTVFVGGKLIATKTISVK